jgi:hypothetical protein
MKVHVISLLFFIFCNNRIPIPICNFFVSVSKDIAKVLILLLFLRKVIVEDLILSSIDNIEQKLFVNYSSIKVLMIVRYQECFILSHELPEVFEIALILFLLFVLSLTVIASLGLLLVPNLFIQVYFLSFSSPSEIHQATY